MGQAPSSIETKGKRLEKDYIYDKDGTTVLKRTVSGEYEPIETLIETQGLNWTLEEKITEQRVLGKRSIGKDSDAPVEKKFQFGCDVQTKKSNSSPIVPSTPSPVSIQKVPQLNSSNSEDELPMK